MIFISVLLLSFLVLGAFFGSFKFSNYTVSRGGDFNPQLLKTVGVLFLSIIIAFVNPVALQVIDAGNVGVKIDRVGDSKGVPQAVPVKGWVFYNSWVSDIVEFSIGYNHVAYKPFAVTAKGGFPFAVEPSFNYSLKPEKVAALYINLLKGNDFTTLEDNFLRTATTLALNNASNKYPIDSIFNNKEQYNMAVADELNRELSGYFTVSQINPGSVSPPELKDVISKKTEAVQKAQQAELDRITAVADAETKIATARGDSAQAVIAASGRARAIEKEQASLTPMYIEYIKAQKWSGNYPTTMVGGNTSGILLNLNKN